jgi:hypothetical protein
MQTFSGEYVPRHPPNVKVLFAVRATAESKYESDYNPQADQSDSTDQDEPLRQLQQGEEKNHRDIYDQYPDHPSVQRPDFPECGFCRRLFL